MTITILGKSARMACVKEGLAFGWTPKQISDVYAIPYNTAAIYAQVARDPERGASWYLKRREQVRQSRRQQRGPLLHRHDQGHRIWTEPEHAQLEDLHRQGLTLTQMGERLGRPRNSIAGKIYRLRRSGRLAYAA